MPAQSITLSFPPLTDNITAFANVDAWNAYFDTVTITINGVNLPPATSATLGAVLSAANAAATDTSWTSQNFPTDYYATVTAFDVGGVIYNAYLPTKDSFDKHTTNILQLKALYDNLIVVLKAAGIMQ